MIGSNNGYVFRYRNTGNKIMDGLGELLFLQFIYTVILVYIIWRTRRKKRKETPYWIIAGLYILTIIWLSIEFIKMPKTKNGGYGSAIGMYSMIIPGILIVCAIITFQNQRNT